MGILDTAKKTGLDAAKTPSKEVVHKTVETATKFKGNKIPGKTAKPDANARKAKEIIIPSEKREEILIELTRVL